jgi:hypothetical protein
MNEPLKSGAQFEFGFYQFLERAFDHGSQFAMHIDEHLEGKHNPGGCLLLAFKSRDSLYQ